MKNVVSTRLSQRELEYAFDGLLAQGIDRVQISTISQLLRLTFLFGLKSLGTSTKAEPSKEARLFIMQKIRQKTRPKALTLQNIIKGKE